MKAKLIDKQSIIFDHKTWNEDKTVFGMASEFDSDFHEYTSSEMPLDAPEGLSYQPYYELRKGIIRQYWELPELSLEELRRIKIQQITDYDNSSAVNEFFINNIPVWLSREERNTLRARFEAETTAGIKNATLWRKGIPISLPPQSGLSMLTTLELYAASSYDCTQQHIANVEAMEKLDILDYDHTAGYPEKLEFNQ